MLRALSGLTTRGRCLLAAGIAAAVCSLVLNERDLLRVAVFVVALPLLVAAFISATRLRIGFAPRGSWSKATPPATTWCRRPHRCRASR